MNHFDRYQTREKYIIHKWIRNTRWLNNRVIQVEAHNTGYHDYLCLLNNDPKPALKVIVEIKEEEHYWYHKTGNIGLDFLSAFNFKEEHKKQTYMKNRLWVKKDKIDTFITEIQVKKYGKLITCDAHIQLFYCEDMNKNTVLMQAYSNAKLQEKSFLQYLKNNYDLRINDKKRYQLEDTWDSAAFFIKACDPRLRKCEINSFEDLILAVKKN